MKKRWYVIDAVENFTSWHDKKEQGEAFATKGAALQRAGKLAEAIPHNAYFICETTDYVVVETKPIKRVVM